LDGRWRSLHRQRDAPDQAIFCYTDTILTSDGSSKMATGICKLTGKRGNFVKAHIIPKALTRPAEKGLPFVQGGQGSRPVRRWDSWYDDHLVIQAGENI
jgi:hypothetical protein